MDLLILSLLALLAGPALLALGRGQGRVELGVRAFVAVTVGGLVLLHLLPRAFERAGWAALGVAALGAAAPFAGHHASAALRRILAPAALGLGLVALLAHAVLDGVALAGPGGAGHPHETDLLALAVVLHRLPLGLSLWWLGRTELGRGAAVALIATEALGTVAGFALGEPVERAASATVLTLFQALMAGLLLHVALDHRPRTETQPGGRGAAWLGGLLALGTLAGLLLTHAEHDEPRHGGAEAPEAAAE